MNSNSPNHPKVKTQKIQELQIGSSFLTDVIGVIRSPFKDKFGVPRQASLVASAKGSIQVPWTSDFWMAIQGLEQFSHLWIVFIFHEHGGKSWKPSIRPPRMGGKQKVGVLASRSPHRPNPIGLSAVRLHAIEVISINKKKWIDIKIEGLDLIDGTPVIDIKPYLPYADSIPEASSGWAKDQIKTYPVIFSQAAEDFLKQKSETRQLIIDVLEIDPRPAYMQRRNPVETIVDPKSFGIEIEGHEVKYSIEGGHFTVKEVYKK